MQPLRERPNNEIGILFHEPELAADASKRFNEHVDRVAFKVELVAGRLMRKSPDFQSVVREFGGLPVPFRRKAKMNP